MEKLDLVLTKDNVLEWIDAYNDAMLKTHKKEKAAKKTDEAVANCLRNCEGMQVRELVGIPR